MKGLRARRDHRRPGWQWSPFVVLLLGPVLAFVLVDHRHGWTTGDILAAVSVAAAISAALAALLDRRLGQRPTERNGLVIPDGLSQERLEGWRVWLRSAIVEARVEQGGQLDQMVRYGEALDLNVSLADGDLRLPRLSVDGRLLAWSEIKREWDESRGRMVILGDPGYGKTVAALTLVAHINERDEPGAVVAELFSLADWYLWQPEHPGARLGDWLAEQLTLTYAPSLPLEVSRQLVAKGLVLPILDGLDEIPTVQQRRVCVDTIDSYTRRADPHRPFVLTCRAEEYVQLAPDWVSAEQHIMLAGLQPDQVNTILNERTVGRSGWDTIRLRHLADDAALRELFRSPLHLAITLQVYRDRDPSELLGLGVKEAIGRLWDLLLSETAGAFQGATVTEVRRWLEFLAAGMRRTDRQRFMLHELYLMDPDRATTRQRFNAILGVVVGLASGLGIGLGLVYGFGHDYGLILGLSFGLISGLFFGLSFGQPGYPADAPSTWESVGWRVRVRHATSRKNLTEGLVVGLTCGLIFGLISGLISGLNSGLIVGLITGLTGPPLFIVLYLADAGTEVVDAEPPARFARKRPDAVLVASRNSGLLSGLIATLSVWLITGLISGLIGWFVSGLIGRFINGLIIGLIVGSIAGLFIGFICGLLDGLDAWLYHYWLRRRLYTRGLLPRRLPQFLSWCAQPSRGWLRITNAYEFRHRALLDHLAPPSASPKDEIQHQGQDLSRAIQAAFDLD
jgi:hypothetical protein